MVRWCGVLPCCCGVVVVIVIVVVVVVVWCRAYRVCCSCFVNIVIPKIERTPFHYIPSCHFSVTSPNLLSVGKLQFDIQFPFAIGVNCWDLYIYVLGSKPWFLLLKSIITLQSWGLEGPRGACP